MNIEKDDQLDHRSHQQPCNQPSDVMARLGTAMDAARSGDETPARELLGHLWDELGSDGDPYHLCAVAHSLADLQDDPRVELMWDLRALAACRRLTDARLAAEGVATSVRGFMPSLHLNLADDYARCFDAAQALVHVAAAREALPSLPDDGYRWMISDALDRVQAAAEAM
ncbi:MAG TPA: hypothetical protein VGM78_10745 [Ilumatobacteraceae bacterium]